MGRAWSSRVRASSMTTSLCLVVFALLLLPGVDSAYRRLNSFIRHYEPLRFDRNDLTAQHERMKRSVDDRIRLEFESHGRYFHLHLMPDRGIFADDATFVDGRNNPIPFDTSEIYRGYLYGDGHSYVFGHLTESRHLDVAIHVEKESYFIEPSSRYFSGVDFHSVMYKGSDVIFDFHNASTCSTRDRLRAELTRANKVKTETPDKSRKRRALNTENTQCLLFLTADQKLVGFFGNEADAFKSMVSHVQDSNRIYSGTDFNGNGSPDLIQFGIRRLSAWRNVGDIPEAPNAPTVNEEFKKDFLGVNAFLDFWSRYDHDGFCLAILFTYRDFDDGVLGLAFVGEPTFSVAGGICETYRSLSFDGGTFKSLNTAVLTRLNFGSTVPSKVSSLTLAHELGHNFGSNHDQGDPGSQCVPGKSNGGNYIMYARATTGLENNNDDFSPCSRSQMLDVIVARGQDAARGCFKKPEAGICGNFLLDDGEECDCGFPEDCDDKCCYPAQHENECQLKWNATCSGGNGPCCDPDTCQYRNASDQFECAKETDCHGPQNCTGLSDACPTPTPRENGTHCNDGANLCVNGECTGSICTALEAAECLCTGKEELCHVCCMFEGVCTSSFELKNKTGLVGAHLAPGSACDGTDGYCDHLNFCMLVDSDGPIARLKNLIFSSESLETALAWIKKYPWAVALIALGLIILVALFIKLCSHATPRGGRRKKEQEKRKKEQEKRREKAGFEMETRHS